jgi:hypothetical protein
MQERLRQFRGSMKIESSNPGTSVIVNIPVPEEVRFPNLGEEWRDQANKEILKIIRTRSHEKLVAAERFRQALVPRQAACSLLHADDRPYALLNHEQHWDSFELGRRFLNRIAIECPKTT